MEGDCVRKGRRREVERDKGNKTKGSEHSRVGCTRLDKDNTRSKRLTMDISGYTTTIKQDTHLFDSYPVSPVIFILRPAK